MMGTTDILGAQQVSDSASSSEGVAGFERESKAV